MNDILWVLEASSLSGGVKVIYEYANRLAGMGHRVTFASLNEKPKWFTLRHNINWFRYQSYPALIEGASNLRPTVAIANWWVTAYAVRDIMNKCGCRGMYLVQDIETFYYFDPVHKNEVMRTYDLGLEMFTTSRWVERQRPDIAYTGIAIGKWSGDSRVIRERKVVACLRGQALKGFRELAELSRYLVSANIPLVTYSSNDGPKLNDMHTHIKGLSDRNLEKLICSATVFASTSRHEGLSMTPLEAMACRTPVVMFNADGNMEYAVDDENCLIATDPEDMAEKVRQVILDRSLASRLAKAGWETARRYASWEKPVMALHSLIEYPVTKPSVDNGSEIMDTDINGSVKTVAEENGSEVLSNE